MAAAAGGADGAGSASPNDLDRFGEDWPFRGSLPAHAVYDHLLP